MKNGDKFIRYYALLAGIAFTVAGIGGFVEGITSPPPLDAPALSISTSYGYLLGLFPINVIHNLFHLGVGVFGLLTFRKVASARRYLQVFGIVLSVLTIMGLIPQLNTTFGIVPLFGHDIWLHGLEGVIGLYLGFFVKVEFPSPQLKMG